MTTEILEKCLKILKRPESDNERLAALLMITKVTKADDCDDASMKRIFDAIGFQFLSRLLRTGMKSSKNSEGSSNHAFQSIAVNIVSSFCSVPGVIDDPGLAVLLPHIASLVVQTSKDEESCQLVDDCYNCLTNIVALQGGPALLIHSGCVSSICQAVIGKSQAYERGLQLLLHLCATCDGETWHDSEKYLLVLIQQLTHDIDNEKTEKKFVLCTSLATILMSVSEDQLKRPDYVTWQQVIQRLLFDLLKNKLAPCQRAPVLRLCSILVDHCGVLWCLQWDQSDSKFLLLLVHLACIEIRMALDTEDLQKIVSADSLLASCYSILEHVIQYMIGGPSLELGDKQITQLHSALVGAFTAVIHFLSRMAAAPQCQDMWPLVVASVRVLGSWIAEETTALKEEVIALLPFLIEISCDTFYKSQQVLSSEIPSSEAGKGRFQELSVGDEDERPMDISEPDSSSKPSKNIKTSPTQVMSSEIVTSDVALGPFSSVEVLQFLMPGLCHLSADDAARKVLLTSDLVQLLYQYLNYQFTRLEKSKKSTVGKEPQTALVTTYGVLLNIIVLETDLVAETLMFGDILALSVQKMIKLKEEGSGSLVLLYNLMLVGLLIVRQRHDKNDLSQKILEDHFRYSIYLLKDVHTSVTSEKDNSIILCNQSQWQDIAEYWKLAVQVLCACITLYPWLPKLILTCKWVQHLSSILLEVTIESVQKDIQVSYKELFHTLAKYSPAVRNVIKDCRGLQLAKKYQWTDLEALL